MFFMLSGDFLKKKNSKNSFRNIIRLSNSIDPDQDRCSVQDQYSACPVHLFVCFIALHPMSTAMVVAGPSVHLTTLFSGQA